jgi:signal transduction histidine kinase
MTIQILALIFFAISLLNALLSFLAIPFFRLQKDYRLFVWMISNLLYSLGSIILAYELSNANSHLQVDLHDKIMVLAQVMRFASIVGLILFLRSFSPKSFYKASGLKIFLIIFPVGIFSVIALNPYVPIEFKGSGVGIFWIIAIVSWLIYELNLMRKSGEYQNSYSLRWLFIVCCVILLAYFGFLLYVLLVYFKMLPWLNLSPAELIATNTSIRLLISLISPLVFILVFMLWLESHSDLAIKSKSNALKVSMLLREQDVLIEKLANSNALIESGALSAGLSHELNQFLARIELNADEALQLIGRPLINHEDLKMPLGNILKANHSAAKLVLSLKKLFGQRKQEYQLVKVDDVVRDTVSMYSPRAKKSHVHIVMNLQVDERQYILEVLFRQALANLLSNAIEALDAISSSNKLIQIQSSIDSNGHYSLAIIDNGSGVHPSQDEKIFSLFATSKSSGSGVGLWLSRHIIERHQGSLTYRNLPDHSGVCFLVTIPINTKSSWGGSIDIGRKLAD